jgi:hypothetical protein
VNETSCPNCGYPDTKDGQHFKGIYSSGMPCPYCQYFQGRMPPESPRVSLNDKLHSERVEKALELVVEKMREGLKGFIGQPNTEETRKGDIVGETHGMTGTNATAGKDRGKGGDNTVKTEGYLDDSGTFIITSQKVTYPEGGPLVAEELDVKFTNVLPVGFQTETCNCPLIRDIDDTPLEKHHGPYCPITLGRKK